MDLKDIHISGGLYFSFLCETFNKQSKKKSQDTYLVELAETLLMEDMLNRYSPNNNESIKSRVSSYKTCAKSDTTMFEFSNRRPRKDAYSRIITNYQACLNKTELLLGNNIDEHGEETLLRYLEIIAKIIILDSNIDSEQKFYICTDGSYVIKNLLLSNLPRQNYTKVSLASFVLGIGQFTIILAEDNTLAEETCKWLFPQNNGRERNFREPEDICILDQAEKIASEKLISVESKEQAELFATISRFAHGDFDPRYGNIFLIVLNRGKYSGFDLNDIPFGQIVEYICDLKYISTSREITESPQNDLTEKDKTLFHSFKDTYSRIIKYFSAIKTETSEIDLLMVMTPLDYYERFWGSPYVKFENKALELIKNYCMLFLILLLFAIDTSGYWYCLEEYRGEKKDIYHLALYSQYEQLEYRNEFLPFFEVFTVLMKYFNNYLSTHFLDVE